MMPGVAGEKVKMQQLHGKTFCLGELDARGMRAEVLDLTVLNLAPLFLPADTPGRVPVLRFCQSSDSSDRRCYIPVP